MNRKNGTYIYDQTIEYLLVQNEKAKVDDTAANTVLLSAVREGKCSGNSKLNYDIEI